MNILVTRAEHQADQLTRQLTRLAYGVMCLPCLDIIDLSQQHNFLSIRDDLLTCAAAIFLSANAVRCTFTHWQPKLSMPIYAIGPATQQALAAFHINSVIPDEPSSSGLLQMKQLQQINVSQQDIAIVSGAKPKPLLADTLTERGAKVTQFFSYRRQCPERLTRKQADSLKQFTDIIIFSAKSCLENFITMLSDVPHTWIFNRHIIVVSQSLKNLAIEKGFNKISCSATALDQDIIDTIRSINP